MRSSPGTPILQAAVATSPAEAATPPRLHAHLPTQLRGREHQSQSQNLTSKYLEHGEDRKWPVNRYLDCLPRDVHGRVRSSRSEPSTSRRYLPVGSHPCSDPHIIAGVAASRAGICAPCNRRRRSRVASNSIWIRTAGHEMHLGLPLHMRPGRGSGGAWAQRLPCDRRWRRPGGARI